jgi:hypothetical protein
VIEIEIEIIFFNLKIASRNNYIISAFVIKDPVTFVAEIRGLHGVGCGQHAGCRGLVV